MYIKRQIEKTIRHTAEMFPAILLTGPRQVGKSTLIRKVFQDVPYITLDDRIVLNALHQDAAGFLGTQGTPLILDEIQREPETFLSLKYQIDLDRRPGMYLLTGSQRFELMKGVSESLAGRIGILNLLGLSAREISGDDCNRPFLPTSDFLQNRRNTVALPQRELWKRIHTGCMPELYANDVMQWEPFYASYVDTYVERDVRALAQVGNTLAFTQFMVALAARTGELLNMHGIAQDVGVDDKTVKRWLSILQASGIIYLLQPFSLNVSKRIVKTPKVYFTDTGLVCYLCRWLTPETLQNGAMAGSIFETYVVGEILKSYYNAGQTPDLYFFRNTDGQEIDLLFYRDNTLFPVEIKKTASPNSKNMKHFQILQTFFPSLKIGEGGIVCSYDKILPLEKRKWVIPVGVI